MLTSWGVKHWLLLVLAAGVLVAYLGLIGSVHDIVEPKQAFEMKVQPKVQQLGQKVGQKVQQLGQRPEVREKFSDPTQGRTEALFALVLFILLTPLAALMGVTMLLFVLASIAKAVAPAVGSERVAMLVLLVVCGIALYAGSGLWMPYAEHVVGYVARAWVVAANPSA